MTLRVPSDITIALLIDLHESAKSCGVTLESALKSAVRNQVKKIGGGTFISATSGNGKTVELQVNRSFDPFLSVGEFTRIYLTYGKARTSLISGGIESPTEQQIFDEMAERLTGVTQFTSDFSNLRLGQPDEETVEELT